MDRQDERDDNEITLAKKRMASASKKLLEMADAMGIAKQVRDWTSERRRNLLAEYMDPDLPATKSETLARKHPQYLKRFEEMAEQSKSAEVTISQYIALQHRFEAQRSLLSVLRESLRQLEG